MLYPCQSSVRGDERRECAIFGDLPRIFSKGVGTFRGGGVSSLARFFAKMHNALTRIPEKSGVCTKNTLATRRVGQLGHKGSLSTSTTSIYIVLAIHAFGKGFFSCGDNYLRLPPLRLLWYKIRTSSQKERKYFPGIPDIFRSFAGFFVFWSSFPRVSPCLSLA